MSLLQTSGVVVGFLWPLPCPFSSWRMSCFGEASTDSLVAGHAAPIVSIGVVLPHQKLRLHAIDHIVYIHYIL